MRFYKEKEQKTLEKLQCNCCGRELKLHRGVPAEGVLHVQKDWGFFSEKDTVFHEFDLCEECYDRIVSRFVIPVEEKELLEL